MDIFAYVSLGLCGILAVVWGVVWLIAMLKEGIGQALLLACALRLLFLSGIVSAVWLIGTKVI